MRKGFKYKTPIGNITIIENNNYVVEISLNKKDVDYTEEETSLLIRANNQLQEYFNLTRTKFDLPILLEGTSFQKKVWTELLKVPYGKTTSYISIAEAINNKGVRAVGTAIGKNPLLLIVPCHRIINKNGSIGGFGPGIDIKKKLHKIEKIDL